MASKGKWESQRPPMDARVGREWRVQARLKDLCKEDKAKIGDLLHVMATERARSREALQVHEQCQVQFQSTVKSLRKQNRALSQERDELKKQLDHSLSLLRKYQLGGEEDQASAVTQRVWDTAGPFSVTGSEFGETFGTSGFRKETEGSQENSSRPSAVGEVKSLRQDLANLSMSLKQFTTGPTGRRALAPLQISEANSRRDSMSPLELLEKSPRPNPVVTPSTLPSASFVLPSPRYDDDFFELLEAMESGRIAQPTPRAGY